MNKSNNGGIYFSEVFSVKHSLVEKYGALDISLICDNPAFIDPFLIFADEKYKELHKFIIDYLIFLRDLSAINKGAELESGTFKHYYKFPEVKQAWLGYSVSGNSGLGLGNDFGKSLYNNLNKIFSEFGNERITESSHLEKLCLIEDGVGVDKISDFTANLIKKYLLEYTQTFALKYIDKSLLKEFAVTKVEFNFVNGLWKDAKFLLPVLEKNGISDFVLLVPRDLLAKDATWISRTDFLSIDTTIFSTIANDELRTKINKYFIAQLKTRINKKGEPEKDYTKKSTIAAMRETAIMYPQIFDYYIKFKEKRSDLALEKHIAKPEQINYFSLTELFQKKFSRQKKGPTSSLEDCIERIKFFKKTLESNSNALHGSGKPPNEKSLQLFFKMSTYGSLFDYNSEVNNGRGPIDFIISLGSADKIGLELKLASNSKLKQNLQFQGGVYAKASDLKHVIKIIFYFTSEELIKVRTTLQEIGKTEDENEIFLVDCRKKESASNVKNDEENKK